MKKFIAFIKKNYKSFSRWFFLFRFKWNFFWAWLPLIKSWKRVWQYWKPKKDFDLTYTELNKIEKEMAEKE